MKILLASKSPRRREILGSLGVKFDAVSADTDECCNEKDPARLVEILAERKGRAVITDENTLVISADTVVVCDGQIFGKPADRADAVRMLKALSGKEHTVISGLSLCFMGQTVTAHEKTQVYFSSLSDETINRYADSSEPYDKAGAYAVQGKASLWIDRIDGCYYNVVGFPTRLFCRQLKKLGIDVFDTINM